MDDSKTKAAVEIFKRAELSSTGSIADLPAIDSRLNLSPPETPADSPMSIPDAWNGKLQALRRL